MAGCKHSEQDIEDLVAPTGTVLDSPEKGTTPQEKVKGGFCWHHAWYPLVSQARVVTVLNVGTEWQWWVNKGCSLSHSNP